MLSRRVGDLRARVSAHDGHTKKRTNQKNMDLSSQVGVGLRGSNFCLGDFLAVVEFVGRYFGDYVKAEIPTRTFHS